jgi:hypothetical protein
MVRSSKPRRPVRPFRLLLTRGGGAELFDLQEDGDPIWSAADDEDFTEEFGTFLTEADLHDIFDYLVAIGELTMHEADQCDVKEEYYTPSDMLGLF